MRRRTKASIDGGAGALVLAVLARHPVRERDVAVEAGLAQQPLGLQLVRRVGVGVHEGDGDASTPCSREQRAAAAARRPASSGACSTPSARMRPRDREPQVARRPAAPAACQNRSYGSPRSPRRDLEHVAEARACTSRPTDRAAALEQRVQADRRAVQEVLGAPATSPSASPRRARRARPRRARRGRRHLADHDPRRSSSSLRTRSVNVPPTSTAIRVRHGGHSDRCERWVNVLPTQHLSAICARGIIAGCASTTSCARIPGSI